MTDDCWEVSTHEYDPGIWGVAITATGDGVRKRYGLGVGATDEQAAIDIALPILNKWAGNQVFDEVPGDG